MLEKLAAIAGRRGRSSGAETGAKFGTGQVQKARWSILANDQLEMFTWLEVILHFCELRYVITS